MTRAATRRWARLSEAWCSYGVWRSLVARFVRDEEVAGSNPVTPTTIFPCQLALSARSIGPRALIARDPADCGLGDLAARPAVARGLHVAGRRHRCLLGHGRVVRPRRSRGSRTSQSAVAGLGALVPDRTIVGSDRGNIDLAGDIRPAGSGNASGGWPRALAEVAAMFLLQLVLFQLAEEIGFTGFLQHHRQDRYHPMKLTLYVVLLWAVWHMPDHFAVEGWGIQALISAPVVVAIEVVSLFFARAIFVWFYNRTDSSVLLVAIFHASFDGSINQLSYDVVPASNTARFLIFSAVIVLFAATMIIATKGRLGRPANVVPVPEAAMRLASTHSTTLQEENRIRGTPEIACQHTTPSLAYVRAGQCMSGSCSPSSSGSSLPWETSQGAAGVPT
jgi:membrane protease YdiL (CAAX protease family)